MNEALEVWRAGPEDVGEIVDILSEAARWLSARGIDQWPDPFPRERVAALVRRGGFHLARLNGQTVGTLALLWSDATFWGARPEDAGYVHALAVRRAWAGRGLGSQLLAWAGEQVAVADREYLRLDCRAENRALRRYYERHGFEQRGEVAVDEFTSALYERRCARPGARREGRRSAGPGVDESARFRPIDVTGTQGLRRYARSGSEGGLPPHPGGRGCG